MGHKHGLGASIMMVRSKEGEVAYIINVRKRQLEWRLPGGGIEEDEAPEEAAVREVWEETGLIIPIEAIVTVTKEIRPNGHVRYFCVAVVDSFDRTHIRKGSSGERAGFFSPQQALYNHGFHLDHRELAKDTLLEMIYSPITDICKTP